MNPLSWLEKTLSKGALAALEGAAVGAPTGALANPQDPASGAVMGAEAGAVGGPLGYAGAMALGRGAPSMFKFLGLRPDRPGAVLRDAQRSLLKRLGYDEARLPELETQLRALQAQGVPATLADLGGENTLGLADVSVRQPGEARNAAIKALQTRQDTQKNLVMDAVKTHVTPTTDVIGEQTRLQKLKKAEAYQQYGAAMAAYPALMDPTLEPLYARLKAVGADKLANDIADARGDPRLPSSAGFIPQAGAPAMPTLGLREWDLLKRGLDAKIQALGPRESTRAAALLDLRDQTVRALDAATTDPQTGVSLYGVARNQFHDFSTTQDAIEAGRNFDKDTSDVAMENFNRLSPSDQAAFRVGVGRRIQDLIEDKRNGVGILNTVVQVKGPRLAQVLGQPAWDGLQNQLQPLFNVARTNNRILGQSATQPRLAEEAATSGEGGFLEKLTEAPTMTQGVLDAAMTQLGHDPHRLHELRADQLTRMLLNPDFHANLATLGALRTREGLDRLWGRVGAAGRYGTAGAAGVGAAALAASPDQPYVEPGAYDQPPDLTGVLPPEGAPGRADGGQVGTSAPDPAHERWLEDGRARERAYQDLIMSVPAMRAPEGPPPGWDPFGAHEEPHPPEHLAQGGQPGLDPTTAELLAGLPPPEGFLGDTGTRAPDLGQLPPEVYQQYGQYPKAMVLDAARLADQDARQKEYASTPVSDLAEVYPPGSFGRGFMRTVEGITAVPEWLLGVRPIAPGEDFNAYQADQLANTLQNVLGGGLTRELKLAKPAMRALTGALTAYRLLQDGEPHLRTRGLRDLLTEGVGRGQP